MHEDVRIALLTVGVVFVAAFAGMTLSVIAKDGLDILTLSSVVIVTLLAIGLFGAFKNPPDGR